MLCFLACAPLVLSMPAHAQEDETAMTMMEEAVKDTDVSVYGRFWPKLTYKEDGDSSTDITDALSHVGIKATTQITETLSAVLHGEWDVDIEANGDFGDARVALM